MPIFMSFLLTCMIRYEEAALEIHCCHGVNIPYLIADRMRKIERKRWSWGLLWVQVTREVEMVFCFCGEGEEVWLVYFGTLLGHFDGWRRKEYPVGLGWVNSQLVGSTSTSTKLKHYSSAHQLLLLLEWFSCLYALSFNYITPLQCITFLCNLCSLAPIRDLHLYGEHLSSLPFPFSWAY